MDTILLQQSDPIVLEVASMVLEGHFNVISFEQFPANIGHIISSYSPKLVIVDFILEGQQAITYLKEIREIDSTLAVIALSCNNDIATVAKIKGFDGYICKPFEIDHLIKSLKNYSKQYYPKTTVTKDIEMFNTSC